MQSRVACAAIFFLLTFSGCLGKDDGSSDRDPETDDGNNPPGNGTVPPPPPPPPTQNLTWQQRMAALPRQWEMTNCTYQGGAYDWLPGEGPGTVPPGWETSSDFLLGSTIYLTFVECERFSVGSFERPVRFAFEGHDKITRPATCDDEYGVHEFSEKLWVNDAEVGQYLATYGMNVSVASIDYQDQATGDVTQRTWTLTPAGLGASELAFRASGPEDELGDHPEKRYVWWNGTVFGFVDLTMTGYYALADSATTNGHMESYTMLGSMGREDYVGRATTRYDLDISAEVFLSSDTLCEEPL